jgi:hypothetical protein
MGVYGRIFAGIGMFESNVGKNLKTGARLMGYATIIPESRKRR